MKFLALLPVSALALSDTERAFLADPSPESARASLKHLTSFAHVAGTPGDHEVRYKSQT